MAEPTYARTTLLRHGTNRLRTADPAQIAVGPIPFVWQNLHMAELRYFGTGPMAFARQIPLGLLGGRFLS